MSRDCDDDLLLACIAEEDWCAEEEGIGAVLAVDVELREDNSIELREDSSFEQRDGP